MVEGVGDVERAVGSERNTERLVEQRAGGGPAIAGRAGHAALTGHGRNGLARDAADAMVAAVGDEQLAVGRPGQVSGSIEQRLCRRAAVAAVTLLARTGEGFD